MFSLAQVEPLISEPEIPHIMTYTEGANAQAISPWLDLNVKEDNEWNVKYPSLRVTSMSISVDDGYIKGEDVLKLPEVPGFESTWDEERGVLTVSAIPGFAFTDDTMDDYEDGQVELVDVTEVINTVEASAKLVDFQEVLRLVQFETTSGGILSRQMSLSANELLTSDTIATITMASLINTPDPPVVIPSPDVLVYREKAPLTPLDSNVEVSKPPCVSEHSTHCPVAIIGTAYLILAFICSSHTPPPPPPAPSLLLPLPRLALRSSPAGAVWHGMAWHLLRQLRRLSCRFRDGRRARGPRPAAGLALVRRRPAGQRGQAGCAGRRGRGPAAQEADLRQLRGAAGPRGIAAAVLGLQEGQVLQQEVPEGCVEGPQGRVQGRRCGCSSR